MHAMHGPKCPARMAQPPQRYFRCVLQEQSAVTAQGSNLVEKPILAWDACLITHAKRHKIAVTAVSCVCGGCCHRPKRKAHLAVACQGPLAAQ